MRQAFLHIGLEKTGTTTLQRTLRDNRALLLENGVAYSEVAGSENHTNLCIYADPSDRNRDLAVQWGIAPFADFGDASRNLPTRLLEEIERLSCDTWIFSNEHLTFRLDTREKIQRLANALNAAFQQVQVVLFIRNQWTLIPSLYGSYIQGGGLETYEQFYKHRLHSLDYEKLFAKWTDVFTKPPVVKLYDRDTLPNGDIVEGFFAAIGLDIPAGMNRVSEQNRSLGYFEIEFLRRVNERFPFFVNGQFNFERGNLDQILASHPARRRFTGTAEQTKAVRDSYQDSNARFALKHLTPAESDRFMAPVEFSEGEATDKDFAHEFVELFSHIYAAKQRQIADLRGLIEQLRLKK